MIDATALLKQFLGADSNDSHRRPAPGSFAPGGSGGLDGMIGAARQALGQATRGGGGMFAGGAAAGGLLGMVLGGKKASKGLGGLLSHGGAALLGAMAHRAYQNWQAGQGSAATTARPAAFAAEPVTEAQFLPSAAPAADGQPFELALVRAMVAAAKADGHIDAAEQGRIFQNVDKLSLNTEDKAFVFDALSKPLGVDEVASAARTPQQAAELYLASRLAIDADHPKERVYLETLAQRLALPPALTAQLDRQVMEAYANA